MKVQVNLQQVTADIQQWFPSNKLTADVSKSGCILIGTRQSLHDSLNIVLTGRGLPDLQQYHYLGLTVRCNLMCNC